jgi:hypothetical protein
MPGCAPGWSWHRSAIRLAGFRPDVRVKPGQPIGQCGDSGNANRAGLHFQVLYRPDTQAGLPVAFTPTQAPELHLRLQAFGVYEN